MNKQTKTNVLFVYNSYGDYGALTFEESLKENGDLSYWVRKCRENNGMVDLGEEEGFTIKLYEIEGEVNEKFVDFIRDHIQDYDEAKHRDFYIVKESFEYEN